MKQILLVSLACFVCFVHSQERYRFSVFGGYQLVSYWGLRDFNNVLCPDDNDVLRIYDHEVYNVNYGNFCSAHNCSFGLSVNWLNRENWMLSHKIGFFLG